MARRQGGAAGFPLYALPNSTGSMQRGHRSSGPRNRQGHRLFDLGISILIEQGIFFPFDPRLDQPANVVVCCQGNKFTTSPGSCTCKLLSSPSLPYKYRHL